MTTVHAYTNDQNLLDLTHNDLRRAHAGATNIVPTSTGAARATGLVLQEMKRRSGRDVAAGAAARRLHHRLHRRRAGHALGGRGEQRVRRAAAEPPLDRVLGWDPIVSSDIVGSPASCTFDSGLTMVMPIGAVAGASAALSLVKVFGWYDNEWGYSNRLVDLAVFVGPGSGR